MARILALSSQVVSGHVGLSAIVPALQRLGHEVLPIPTILLSNHPGQQPAKGSRIEPAVQEEIIAALETNGRLTPLDAILTGYLPTAAHVAVAVAAVTRCRHLNKKLVVLCDPVIGDDPKGVYIDQAAAVAIRVHLLNSADILTPNRFELSWLSGLPVTDAASAIVAARSLNRPLIIATSVPTSGEQLATLAVTPDKVAIASVSRRTFAPNGTGDLLAALFLARYLEPTATVDDALCWSVAEVERVLVASSGRAELHLTIAPN